MLLNSDYRQDNYHLFRRRSLSYVAPLMSWYEGLEPPHFSSLPIQRSTTHSARMSALPKKRRHRSTQLYQWTARTLQMSARRVLCQPRTREIVVWPVRHCSLGITRGSRATRYETPAGERVITVMRQRETQIAGLGHYLSPPLSLRLSRDDCEINYTSRWDTNAVLVCRVRAGSRKTWS